MPRKTAASNISCDKVIAADRAMTSRENREFHAGAALREHGRHAARDLRDAARLVRRLLYEGGKTLTRLMRREHVVIGGDDGEIGGGTGTQGLLFAPGASGKTMRKIGTSERSTVRPRYFSREGWLRARTRAVTSAIAVCTISGSLVAAGWLATPPASGQSVSSLQLRPSRSTRAIAAAGPQVPAR
jgi:hypothetical protein